MRLLSRAKALIIGVLCLASLGLSGCNALRLGYGNGPTLAWWWLDGYVDFSREHSPAVKQAIERWFDWHRSSELPGYAAFLAGAQAEVMVPTTPQAACQWQDRVRTLLEPALDRALQEAADQLPALAEPQFRHIAQRYLKGNDEMRRDFLQSNPKERLEASIDRAVERAERLYGRLDDAQKKVIAAGVTASPFDPALWLQERERRQGETLQVLRRLHAERADRAERLAALRALAERTERSPVPEYRAYQQRLGSYNCALAAQIHNATTPAQREAARDRLKGWEDDLRSLLVVPRND